MITFKILLIPFLVAFIANLVHWHGSGPYVYKPEIIGGRLIQIGIRAAVTVIVVLVLAFTRTFVVVILLDIFMGLSVAEDIAAIWSRHRLRVQAHAEVSA